jgi:hypothetical protein
LRRELIGNDATNDALCNDLCISLSKAGEMLAQQGDVAAALAHHREALAMRRALAAKHPHNPGWRDDVAWSLRAVDDLLGAQRDK